MSDWDETQIASSDSKQRKLQKDSKKWNVGETTTLIELLKEREKQVWNFGKAILEKPVEAVEVKINGLPAQLGQEINKETKTKSEQSSDKQYHDVFGAILTTCHEFNWTNYNQIKWQFVWQLQHYIAHFPPYWQS